MRSLIFGILVVATVVFSGCGSGGSTTSSSAAQTGYLIDSAVKGVTYSTATQSGTTDSSGKFLYKTGETVTFKVGDVTIGSASGASKLSPFELAGTTDPTDAKFRKLIVLLQSLDADQNASNGIDINASLLTGAASTTISSSTDLTALAANLAAKGLVSEAAALQHVQSATGLINDYSSNFSGSVGIDDNDTATFSQVATTGIYINSYQDGVTVDIVSPDTSIGTAVDLGNAATYTDYNITIGDQNATAVVFRVPKSDYNNTVTTTIFKVDLNSTEYSFKLSQDINDDKIIRINSSGLVLDPYVANSVIKKVEDNSTVGYSDPDGNVVFTTTPTDGDILRSEGGTDLGTGKTFNGVLKAVYQAGKKTVFTPISTLIAQMKTPGESVADVQQKVATFLGVSSSVLDIDKDPLQIAADGSAEATEARKAVKKAAQVQKVIQTFTAATAGSLADKEKAIAAVTNSIKKSVDAQKTAEGSTSWIDDVNASDLGLDENTTKAVAKAATVVSEKIEQLDEAALTSKTAIDNVAKAVETVTKTVETMVANGETEEAAKVAAVMPKVDSLAGSMEGADIDAVVTSTTAAKTDLVNKFDAISTIISTVSDDLNASEDPEIVLELINKLAEGGQTVDEANATTLVEKTVEAVATVAKQNETFNQTVAGSNELSGVIDTNSTDKTVDLTALDNLEGSVQTDVNTTKNTVTAQLTVNTAPTISFANATVSVKENASITLRPSLVDAEDTNLTITNSAPTHSTIEINGSVITITGDAVTGDQTEVITFTVDDGNKTGEANVTITVTDNLAPTLTLSGDANITFDMGTISEHAITATVADENGDTMTLGAAISGNATVTPTTKTMTDGSQLFTVGKGTAADGDVVTLDVNATDGAETNSSSVTINFYKLDDPVITFTNTTLTQTVSNLNSFTRTFNVSDADFGVSLPADENATVTIASSSASLSASFDPNDDSVQSQTITADTDFTIYSDAQYEGLSANSSETITVTVTDSNEKTATTELAVTVETNTQTVAPTTDTNNGIVGSTPTSVATTGAITVSDFVIQPNSDIFDALNLGVALNSDGLDNTINTRGDIAMSIKQDATELVGIAMKDVTFKVTGTTGNYVLAIDLDENQSSILAVAGDPADTNLTLAEQNITVAQNLVTDSNLSFNLDTLLTPFGDGNKTAFKDALIRKMFIDGNYTYTIVFDTNGKVAMPFDDGSATVDSVTYDGPAVEALLEVHAQAFAPNLDVNNTLDAYPLEYANILTFTADANDSNNIGTIAGEEAVNITVISSDPTAVSVDTTNISGASGTFTVQAVSSNKTSTITVIATRNDEDETNSTVSFDISTITSLTVDQNDSTFVIFNDQNQSVTSAKIDENVTLRTTILNVADEGLSGQTVEYRYEDNASVIGSTESLTGGLTELSFIKPVINSDINISAYCVGCKYIDENNDTIPSGTVLIDVITLTHTNSAPVYNGGIPADINGSAGTEFLAQDLGAAFSDADIAAGDQNLTFTMTAVSGMTLETNGTLHGNFPGASEANVTVTATDEHNATATATFNINIAPLSAALSDVNSSANNIAYVTDENSSTARLTVSLNDELGSPRDGATVTLTTTAQDGISHYFKTVDTNVSSAVDSIELNITNGIAQIDFFVVDPLQRDHNYTFTVNHTDIGDFGTANVVVDKNNSAPELNVTSQLQIPFDLEGADQNITFDVNDDNNDSLDVNVTDSADVGFVATPANQTVSSGSYTITIAKGTAQDGDMTEAHILVTDESGITAEQNVSIGFYQNDAPTMTLVDENVTIQNLNEFSRNFTVTDADFGVFLPTEDNVTVTVTSSNPSVVASFDYNDDNVTSQSDINTTDTAMTLYVYAEEANLTSGSVTSDIVVTATDRYGKSESKTVTVTVLANAAVMTPSADENTTTFGTTQTNLSNGVLATQTTLLPNSDIFDALRLQVGLDQTGLDDFATDGGIIIEISEQNNGQLVALGMQDVLYKVEGGTLDIILESGMTRISTISQADINDANLTLPEKTVDSNISLVTDGNFSIDLNSTLALFGDANATSFKNALYGAMNADGNYSYKILFATNGLVEMPFDEDTISVPSVGDFTGPTITANIALDARKFDPLLSVTPSSFSLEQLKVATFVVDANDSANTPSGDVNISYSTPTYVQVLSVDENGTVTIQAGTDVDVNDTITITATRDGSDESTSVDVTITLVQDQNASETNSTVYLVDQNGTELSGARVGEEVYLATDVRNSAGDSLSGKKVNYYLNSNDTLLGSVDSNTSGLAIFALTNNEVAANFDVRIELDDGDRVVDTVTITHINSAPVFSGTIPNITGPSGEDVSQFATLDRNISQYFSDVDIDLGTGTWGYIVNNGDNLNVEANGTLTGYFSSSLTGVTITADDGNLSVTSNEFNVTVQDVSADATDVNVSATTVYYTDNGNSTYTSEPIWFTMVVRNDLNNTVQTPVGVTLSVDTLAVGSYFLSSEDNNTQGTDQDVEFTTDINGTINAYFQVTTDDTNDREYTITATANDNGNDVVLGDVNVSVQRGYDNTLVLNQNSSSNVQGSTENITVLVLSSNEPHDMHVKFDTQTLTEDEQLAFQAHVRTLNIFSLNTPLAVVQYPVQYATNLKRLNISWNGEVFSGIFPSDSLDSDGDKKIRLNLETSELIDD
jgi:hypothetical protein